MKIVLSACILLLVAACAAPVQRPVSYQVMANPIPESYIHKKKAHRVQPIDNASSGSTDDPPVSGHNWKIEEDRFISSHDIDVSVDALKMPKEQIQARLDLLKTK